MVAVEVFRHFSLDAHGYTVPVASSRAVSMPLSAAHLLSHAIAFHPIHAASPLTCGTDVLFNVPTGA